MLALPERLVPLAEVFRRAMQHAALSAALLLTAATAQPAALQSVSTQRV